MVAIAGTLAAPVSRGTTDRARPPDTCPPHRGGQAVRGGDFSRQDAGATWAGRMPATTSYSAQRWLNVGRLRAM